MKRVQRIRLIAVVVLILVLGFSFVYSNFAALLPFGRVNLPFLPSAFPATTPQVTVPTAGVSGFSGVRYTVGVAQQAVRVGTSDTGRHARGVFLLVPLTVQNTGREPLALAPGDVALLDSQGRRFSPDVAATRLHAEATRGDSLLETTVQPGLTLSGVLVFDVPTDASGLVLRVSRGYIDLALETAE